MRARDLMLGHSIQRRLVADLPSTLLGLNDPEDGARFTRSWDDLKDCFRSHRVFLNTTIEGYEDGYNLAMLEAMATGMPIVSTANTSSPIVDGVNGFVSGDEAYLSSRLRELLADRTLAARLGAAARDTVAERFPMQSFVDRWQALLADAADAYGRSRRASSARARREPAADNEGERDLAGEPRSPARAEDVRSAGRVRRRILLSYVSYPATTARYLERALRRGHDVLTVGPAIGDALIQAWNLQAMRERPAPHDIPCSETWDAEALLAALPREWRPDVFLWVESVHGHFPRNIRSLDCPTACYMIDSHLNLSWHLDWAAQFDYVFVAQKAYVSDFQRAGCPHVSWLPLGCDLEIHGRADVPLQHEVAFVGSLGGDRSRRRELLERLSARVRVHVERSFLQDMARTFSASRIVFNESVKDDLNMRVFEALASGSMLLTDAAPGSGLDEMFVDRRHLVVYRDDEVAECAAYYLAHDDEREAIARAGREEALQRHSYLHRADRLLETIFERPYDAGVDRYFVGDVEDALLAQALELARERRWQASLARLALATDERDLAPRERFERDATMAECLQRLGRVQEAAAALAAAQQALSRDDREAFAAMAAD
jgi:glycosyltransferase involved in cell wall biosynthesis